jgi:mRNA interferase MazF
VNFEIKRGQLYWVNFDPALGSEASSIRPALVISGDKNNRVMPIVTIAPITSSVKKLYPFEVFLAQGEGGLQQDSKVQIPQLRAVSRERLLEYIGTVEESIIAATIVALKLHFEIDE